MWEYCNIYGEFCIHNLVDEATKRWRYFLDNRLWKSGGSARAIRTIKLVGRKVSRTTGVLPGLGKVGTCEDTLEKDLDEHRCLCDQWILKSKRTDLDEVYKKDVASPRLCKTYKICSDHFVITLKPGPVPTQNLSSISTPSTKRSSPKKRKRVEDDPEESSSNEVQE
ncbi:Protein of unknown function [Gryllus bimaculatus]|nr:Protein of unknown function [Gryllus bimaculatus]